MTTTLARALSVAAERVPAADAVVDGGHRESYRALDARVNRVAGGLARLGVGKGDHVVLLLKNRLEHVALYWACQKLGAIATPLNWRYAEEDVRFCSEDAEAVAVVFEAASAGAALGARPRLPAVKHWLSVGVAPRAETLDIAALAAGGGDPGPPPARLDPTDVSIMLYTSGTTGRPKGVPRTHRAEASAALAHIVQSRNTFGERTLAAMPLYHTMGVRSTIAMALLHGALVCLPDWDAAAAARLLHDERVTALYLVPTLYHDLVSLPDLAGRDVGSVRRLGYAGAPMSSTLTRRVGEAFRPDVFVNHLGSTEVYTFTVCDRVLEKPTCAGRSGLFGRTRIVRADADRGASPHEPVARGEIGELIVSLDSPEAFSGYWRCPDADARAIRDGWYFTGDLAWEDGEGDIYTVGRVDDMIISGGENIHPTEVEDVLLRHPDVREACVVGLPDERLGQTVTAFVVVRRGSGGAATVGAEELDRFCRAAKDFAAFKRPRRYRFVDALPRSPTGKLLRRQLLQ